MKPVCLYIFLFLWCRPGLGQTHRDLDTCSKILPNNFNLFIAGYRDTVQTNGIKVRNIDRATLVNGFRLEATDTSVRVQQFRLAFDAPDGTIYVMASVGDKISDNRPGNPILPIIRNAGIITVDDIRVRYRGKCYKVSGQVYLPR